MSATEQHDEHAHPTEKSYWIVFVVLAVITAVEVAWSYLGFEGVSLVLPLVGMMLVKFVLVGGAFMHLYHDGRSHGGRSFSLVFGAGLLIAVAVFVAVVAAFDFGI